jgi:hypothetical protein
MWLEAILSNEDLTALVGQLAPLTIPLADQGHLEVTDPHDITLVAGVGLRLICKAKLRWPVLGIDVPITLKSVTVVLRPEIAKDESGESLVFKLEIEHADFAGIPTMLDTRITEKVNKELAAKHVELAWDFKKSLSHVFKLPESLQPIDAIALDVAWGEIKVTDKALVFAVSFHAAVTRSG